MNPLDSPAPDDPSTHAADDSTGSVTPPLIPHDAPTLPGTWVIEHEREAEQPEHHEEPHPAAFDDISMPTPIVPPAALNMDYFMEPPQSQALPPVGSETPAPPRRWMSAPLGVVAVLVIGALVVGVLAGGALLHQSNPGPTGRRASPSGGGAAAAKTATTGVQGAPPEGDSSSENASATSGSGTRGTTTPTGAATPGSTTGTQPGAASTATATPVAPRLTISPTSVTLASCTTLTSYPSIQVQNTGGGRLTWQATPSDSHVQVQPGSGELEAGEPQNVTLSSNEILGSSFTVNFTSNGGSATLTVTCQTGSGG